MKVNERIARLRNRMAETGIDIYIVPTADYHQSEYVGEYFKSRQFITGFTGSAGTAIITMNDARLWTDGRYFIQANQQLAGTEIILMKDAPLSPFLTGTFSIGCDGRTLSVAEGKEYAEIADKNGGYFRFDCDFIGDIWKNRPDVAAEPVWELDIKYAGESAENKIARVRQEMKRLGADTHILTTLDDICWLLNIRGGDIQYFPLVLSYAIVTLDGFILYIDDAKIDDNLKAKLARIGVSFRPYNDIYEDVINLRDGSSVLIDPDRLNYALYNSIPKSAKVIEARNPEVLMKAIKNDVEVANIRKAELKDSIAHVKFMKWVKENYDKSCITEMSAMDKLEELKDEQGNYIGPSFDSISAYGEHGAIIHYSSTLETDVQLKAGSLYLTDTGAGYYEGSTDITRTYALGEVTQEMKQHFTLVAIANLRLADVRFAEGTIGKELDSVARKPLNECGLNYNHGTGHGVGYLLNIHEGPSGFSLHAKGDMEPFHENMITTDEPGVYIEGSHGIRLENELLCCIDELADDYNRMFFETITYIPFDLDAIDARIMSDEDKQLLNNYHRLVYKKIAPHLDEEERVWLAKYTAAI